jgi:hypothetical protein
MEQVIYVHADGRTFEMDRPIDFPPNAYYASRDVTFEELITMADFHRKMRPQPEG